LCLKGINQSQKKKLFIDKGTFEKVPSPLKGEEYPD
jgi:hypothetical protein